MNKNMDVNFAFAILLLVAAIVGMYFWLDRANEEVGDIYQGDQSMVIERGNMSNAVVEEGAEIIDGSDVSGTIE